MAEPTILQWLQTHCFSTQLCCIFFCFNLPNNFQFIWRYYICPSQFELIWQSTGKHLAFLSNSCNFSPFGIIKNCCVLITVTFKMLQISSKVLWYFLPLPFIIRFLNSSVSQWNFSLRRNTKLIVHLSNRVEEDTKYAPLNSQWKWFQVALPCWKQCKGILLLQVIWRQYIGNKQHGLHKSNNSDFHVSSAHCTTLQIVHRNRN